MNRTSTIKNSVARLTVWKPSVEAAMSENKQEARCIHCGRPMSKHPHVGVDPCPTARQANQPQLSVQDRRDLRTKLDAALFNKHGGGSVSSRWTVDSILDAIMPIIAAHQEPQGKAQPEQPGINLARWIWQRFAGIPITEPYDGEFRLLLLKIASYTDELKQRQSFADFHAESKEPSAAQEFEVKARVAIAGRFAQREPHYDAWSEPMRIVREVLAELGAAPPQGEAEKDGRT